MAEKNMNETTTVDIIEQKPIFPEQLVRKHSFEVSEESILDELKQHGVEKRFNVSPPVLRRAAIKVDSPKVHKSQKNIMEHLERLKNKHMTSSSAHSLTADFYEEVYHALTITIIVVSLLGTLLINILEEPGNDRTIKIVSSVFYTITATLTAVNNFLGFQKKAQLHIQLRDEHRRLVDNIELALSIKKDNEEERGQDYDFQSILEQIQEINSTLKKASIQIPSHIKRKFRNATTDQKVMAEIRIETFLD